MRLIQFTAVGAGLLCLGSMLCGCASALTDMQLRESGGNAALYRQFRAFDGRTGRSLTFGDVVTMAQSADVVLFGEQHSNAVCNGLEAQLLAAMSAQGRPVSLAMEFFERDTQPSLDAYLDGRIDEGDFNALTRRNKAYATSHRPMIEYCRDASIPVIAANAPWRLMRAMGKSGLSFAEYRLSVEPADRAWMPRESEMLKGAYRERFESVMGSHGDGGSTASTQPAASQPATSAPVGDGESELAGDESAASEVDNKKAPVLTSGAETVTTAPVADASENSDVDDVNNETEAASQPVTDEPKHHGHSHTSSQPAEAKPSAAERMEKAYRAQSLWDDAMAEAVCDHRGRFANRRVMLVVGVFHVEREGGLWTKVKRARPEDAVLTIVFRGAQPPFAFDEADLGAGDVVIYGIAPPEDEEEPGS